MISHVLLAILLGAAIALSSYGAKLLTGGGAVAQCVLGSLLLALGDWQWVVPILAFFLPSSMFSRIGRQRKGATDKFFAKGTRRDALQVMANGGIGAVLVVCWYANRNPVWFVAYLSAIAAATADTWGTELGIFSRNPPVLITTWKRVERGVSGGISLLGCCVAVLGAMTIMLSGLFWLPADQMGRSILIVVGAGTSGALLDSLLGATIQMQFLCPVCHRITERPVHCDVGGAMSKGLPMVDNDMVNLLSTWAAGAIAAVVFLASSQ